MSLAGVGVPTRGRHRRGRHHEPPTRFSHHDAPVAQGANHQISTGLVVGNRDESPEVPSGTVPPVRHPTIHGLAVVLGWAAPESLALVRQGPHQRYPASQPASSRGTPAAPALVEPIASVPALRT